LRALAAAVSAVALAAVAALVAPGHDVSRADPAPCTPVPGTRWLAPIDGRVPVAIHVGSTAKAGAPLILVLPGANQTATDMSSYTGYSRMADRAGFSVAYPTASGARPFWNISGTLPGKPDDVAYLRQVIPAAVAATCADPARVGVTGVSNGGGMTARLACDAADLIAAAAPVAGGYSTLPPCHPARPVPVLEIHGGGDRTVPYDGKPPDGAGAVPAFLAQWRAIDGCTGATLLRIPRAGVLQQRWPACTGGTVVQSIRIDDAQHGWPGQDHLGGTANELLATPRTWEFLSAFRR
jgi:polyhydroxybutyrate depolymerase